jgi:hypothetical protein
MLRLGSRLSRVASCRDACEVVATVGRLAERLPFRRPVRMASTMIQTPLRHLVAATRDQKY